MAYKTQKYELTDEEKYTREYMDGYRIGRINTSRKYLIRVLHLVGKIQGVSPSKEIIRKINREVDCGFLDKLFYVAIDCETSIKDFENKYDKTFHTEDEIRNEKYTIYK